MTSPITTSRSLLGRLYHGETNIDFVGRFRRWLTLSLTVIAIGVVAFIVRGGLNLGIDFEGGSVWEVPAGDASVSDARDAVTDAGVAEATIQTLESDGEVRLRVEAEEADAEIQQKVVDELVAITGASPDDVSFTSVGPSWGNEISEKAIRALVFFFIAITIYITLRFEWKMAVPTLAALLHDILVTIGIYALFAFEVTPATVIALLTILGYSIYDGIVVFDKVDENTKMVTSGGTTTYASMVNLSLNQVLMRSLNTSITALLPVGSLLVIGSWLLGAVTLQEFALALLVGLFASAYSSIFIASPLLAKMKEREPRYRELRRRIEARAGLAPPPPSRVADERSVIPDAGDEAADASKRAPLAREAAVPPIVRPIPPRPRKKGRRR